ncbi:MAG: sulfatase-like hydrolase/transferase [Flavisolibacter sp.]
MKSIKPVHGWVIAIGLFMVVFPFSNCFAQPQKQKPNIIFIMVDDMGYADLGSYGRKDYLTPNLDRMAAEGTRFTHAYSGAPVCTPARVSFMTGQYPAKHKAGLYEPLTGDGLDSLEGLDGSAPSVPAMLKAIGYETVLIGKWHLGFDDQHGPRKNGFEDFFGFRRGAIDFISHKAGRARPDLWENETAVDVKGYMTDILTDRAIGFLNKKHERPFFLSLQYNAPHWPWQAPGDAAYPDTMRYVLGGSPVTYAGMMKSLDDNIGRFMDALSKSGLKENTLVIFMSDNGGERYSDMGPLRGKKMTLWEGGIRVPAFASWPGRISAGQVTDQKIITMDWSATILDAAGVKVLSDLDGVSLLSFFKKPSKTFDRNFFWRLNQRVKQMAHIEGQWKYVKDDKGEYLFNLEKDISEKEDLKEKHPDIFERLRKKMQDWDGKVLTPVVLAG